MADPIKLNGSKTRFVGRADFVGLCRQVQGWMESNEMWVQNPSYKDKTTLPGMTEKEVYYVGRLKLDEMIQVKIDVKIRAWDVKPEMHNNQKVLGGRFEIEITGVLMEDYDTIFAQKNILKKMGKIWSKVFSREYNMKTADTWNSKLVDLQNQLKMQMGLLTTQ